MAPFEEFTPPKIRNIAPEHGAGPRKGDESIIFQPTIQFQGQTNAGFVSGPRLFLEKNNIFMDLKFKTKVNHYHLTRNHHFGRSVCPNS